MKTTLYLAITTVVASFLLSSCNSNDADSLSDIEIIASYYEGDNYTVLQTTSATIRSNRDISFGISNYTEDITKVEVIRTTGGETVTCELTTNEGGVRYNYSDWPAADTDYTIMVYAGSESVSFGPFTISVVSADQSINGDVAMSDQDNDGNGYGSFFQSRHVGWGGGWTYANWRSLFADENPRILDFAILSQSGQLMAVSPDDVASIHVFDLLSNDCGYMSTLFEVYTGPFDPETNAPSLAEIEALPEPTSTTINISEETRFIYQTQDGKKGLIKVKDIVDTGSSIRFRTHYSCMQ